MGEIVSELKLGFASSSGGAIATEAKEWTIDSHRIEALMTGRAVRFTDDGDMSAIAKARRAGPLAVTPLGLAGDEQADLSVHGGPDKALHHYPRDHYAAWDAELGGHPLLREAGAFGENISTRGLTEEVACIGDRYRLGSALVEISQGRQPCWKLGHHFGVKALTARVVETRKSGWYYRVIETGIVAEGDHLSLVARPHGEWTVRRVFALLVGGGVKADLAAVRALAGLDSLAETWRARAAKLGRRDD